MSGPADSFRVTYIYEWTSQFLKSDLYIWVDQPIWFLKSDLYIWVDQPIWFLKSDLYIWVDQPIWFLKSDLYIWVDQPIWFLKSDLYIWVDQSIWFLKSDLYILVVFDIHVYQCFISYTCSVRYCAMWFFYKQIVFLFAMHLLYSDIILTKIFYVIYLHWLPSVKIQINTNINTIHLKKTRNNKIKIHVY
jgi:hypothetical protein